MNDDIVIVIGEDDDGHAALVERNIKRAGVINQMIRFKNGEEVWAFFSKKSKDPSRVPGKSYLLLLDIRMPKMDGIEVLRRIKEDHELKKMPVIMVTTTDDPGEVARCHQLGCNNYIIKPVDYKKFVSAIQQLGLFLKIVMIPHLNGDNKIDNNLN